MAIRLKWKNPNSGASVVRIYRGATPIDTSNMAGVNPIVEISDGSTSYVDEFPKYGQSFYYVFSVTIGGREIFSINKLYSCVIDLGPGPKDLLIGDFKLGYFGSCGTGDLGFASTVYGQGISFYTLHKIARNGKILYIPGITISSTINTLKDNKALTSGVATPRNDPFAGAAGRIIDVNGRLFAPRVAKMYDDANTDVTNSNYGLYSGFGYTTATGYSQTPIGKSELVDVIRVSRSYENGAVGRFFLGTDTLGYQTGYDFTVVASCDFMSATQVQGFGNLLNFGTNPRAMAFTTGTNFHPVIEYKGLV